MVAGCVGCCEARGMHAAVKMRCYIAVDAQSVLREHSHLRELLDHLERT